MICWSRCFVVTFAMLSAASCGYYRAEPADQDPVGTGGDGAPTSVGSDLPCEVAELLAEYCSSCHTEPPRGGAPMPLVSFDNLTAPSFANADQNFAERAVLRMQDSSSPMPPQGLPAPSDEQLAAFRAWVDEGTPLGECETGVDGGDAGPTGPHPTTCSSGDKWPENWESLDAYDNGGPDMNPGLACRNCHVDENDDQAYFFMGTVFPTLHEEDRCYSQVPSGTLVQIIDANGQVAIEMPVRESGNFFEPSFSAQIDLPFTARVVRPDGSSIQMNTPQMTGDCNGCHTEQGENGAPGRILLPAN